MSLHPQQASCTLERGITGDAWKLMQAKAQCDQWLQRKMTKAEKEALSKNKKWVGNKPIQ